MTASVASQYRVESLERTETTETMDTLDRKGLLAVGDLVSKVSMVAHHFSIKNQSKGKDHVSKMQAKT